jgi:hypothetical protein
MKEKSVFTMLPIVIFDIIHSYISHYDYRQLMNCNHHIFCEIKYETVYYDLISHVLEDKLYSFSKVLK